MAQSDWQGEWVDPETEEIDIPGDDAINAFARPNWERKQAEKEALDPDADYTEDNGNFEIPPEDDSDEDTSEEQDVTPI